MIKFIVDTQLPPRLARWLSAQGNLSNQDLMSQFHSHMAVIARAFEEGVELLLFDINQVTRY